MINIKTSVKEIAKKLGVSTQAVYAWKLGRFLPSTSRLKKIAKIEGVTIDKLIK